MQDRWLGRRAKGVLLVVAYSLLFCGGSFAFRSGCFGDTLEQIAKHVIQESILSSSEYPDIWRFRERLIAGSVSEDGHPNITANEARGNSLNSFWQGTKDLYELESFTDSYYVLGIMEHLVQDEANPAHAFDIGHVSYVPAWEWPTNSPTRKPIIGDHLETYASKEEEKVFDPDATDFERLLDPTAYYETMIQDTRAVVQNNVNPPDRWVGPNGPPVQADGTQGWDRYWLNGSAHIEPVRIPGLVRRDSQYIGFFGPNEFPEFIEERADIAELNARRSGEPFHPYNRFPNDWFRRFYTPFVNSRVVQAIRYTAGCWAVASEQLRPLIKWAVAV